MNDPDAEHFAHVRQRVFIAVRLVQAFDLFGVADAAWHNAVHQGGAENVLAVDPGAEFIGQLPVVDVLVDALEQFLAVVVDQLAGEHHDAGLAGGEALVEHAGQLGGEADGRALVECALRVVHDAGLGGVGDDDVQIVGFGEFQHLVPVPVGVDAAADAGDDALVVHLDALFVAAQVQGVQAFLLVDQVGQALGDRLHQDDFAVVSNLFVGDVKEIIDKGAQEVAFPELHHLFGRAAENVSFVSGFREYFVIQLIHKKFLPRF